MHTYLTPAQMEATYGIAVSTAANRRSLGLGPDYVKLPNGRIRYRDADVRAWIESGSVAA